MPRRFWVVAGLLVALTGVRTAVRERPRKIRCEVPFPIDTGKNETTRSDLAREWADKPDVVLEALKIRPGATVADVGAGTGYFAWRLAEKVGPSGRVIAQEIDPKLVDVMAAEVKRRNIANLEIVLGETGDPRLPVNAVDLVLLVRVFHEFTEREAMMHHIRRALKPDGRLVVMEFRGEDPSNPEHKMTMEEVRSGVEALGFRVHQVLDVVPRQHVVVFTKRRLTKKN